MSPSDRSTPRHDLDAADCDLNQLRHAMYERGNKIKFSIEIYDAE